MDPLNVRPKQTRSGVRLHVRTRTPLFYISETAGPIELKFAVRLEINFLKVLDGSWVWSNCTCAREDPFSISRERLGLLSSNLVYTEGPTIDVFWLSHGWGVSALAHVHTPFPYHENGWADCVPI